VYGMKDLCVVPRMSIATTFTMLVPLFENLIVSVQRFVDEHCAIAFPKTCSFFLARLLESMMSESFWFVMMLVVYSVRKRVSERIIHASIIDESAMLSPLFFLGNFAPLGDP